jgi:phosphatidate cytidylyltransferase
LSRGVLKTRIITALVLIPLTLAALFGLPPRAWGAVTLAIVVIAATEWAELAALQRRGWLLFVGTTLFTGCVLLLDPAAAFRPERGWPDPMVSWICGAATIFWLLIAPAWLASGRRVASPLVLAVVGWLVLIATWMAVVVLQTRSPGLLLAMMAIVWIADTAAYFTGRRFGRRKLAPAISPGKTWEGVYGALAAVALYALLLLPFAAAAGYSRPLDAVAAAIWVVLALILTGLSIVGDLFESQLKRQRGVKDSGAILPGHGGVLDRIDALTAAMPPAALIAHHLLR